MDRRLARGNQGAKKGKCMGAALQDPNSRGPDQEGAMLVGGRDDCGVRETQYRAGRPSRSGKTQNCLERGSGYAWRRKHLLLILLLLLAATPPRWISSSQPFPLPLATESLPPLGLRLRRACEETGFFHFPSLKRRGSRAPILVSQCFFEISEEGVLQGGRSCPT